MMATPVAGRKTAWESVDLFALASDCANCGPVLCGLLACHQRGSSEVRRSKRPKTYGLSIARIERQPHRENAQRFGVQGNGQVSAVDCLKSDLLCEFRNHSPFFVVI